MPVRTQIDDDAYKKLVVTKLKNTVEETYHQEFDCLHYITGTTIPDLPKILENAEQDLILQWLQDCIIPYINSNDDVICNYDRHYNKDQTINQPMDQGHIVYQLLRTEWLNINGKTVAPECCLIKQDNLFPDDLVCFVPDRVKYETVWKLLGIPQYVHQLPAEVFYGILRKLPDIDPKGKISERIYNQITKNAEPADWDRLAYSGCKNQEIFFKSGQLWSKTKIKTEFWPVTDVYFSSKKNINRENKHIMKTPLRNGNRDNFKKVFNIPEFIENEVADYDACIKHQDNTKFEQDFQNFKPYLHALSATEELNKAIPGLTISLCKRIKLVNDSENISFEDYDIVEAKNNKFCVFLNNNANLDTVRIATVIGDICDTVSKSADIGDTVTALYLQGTDEERKRWLENKGCDTSLLFAYKDVKQLFIETMIAVSPNVDAQELLRKYPINFEDLKSPVSLQSIRSIVTELNTDVASFQDHGFMDIHFESANSQLLCNYVNNNMLAYQEYLYNDLFDKSIAEQEQFETKLDEFRQHQHDSVNVHNFDPKKYLPIPQYEQKHVFTEDILKSNRDRFFTQCSDKKLAAELIENNANTSLLLFGQFDELHTRYQDAVTQQNEQDKNNKETEKTPTILTIITHEFQENTSQEQNVSDNKQGQQSEKKHVKRQFKQSINEKKQQNGMAAEQAVYDTLVNKYGKNNVKWENGNAALAQNIIGCGDDATGYDMTYKDENGNWQYAEVKHATHVNNNLYSFIISAKEVETAKQNPDNYNVFLVTDSKHVQQIKGPDVLRYVESAILDIQRICVVPCDNNSEI